MKPSHKVTSRYIERKRLRREATLAMRRRVHGSVMSPSHTAMVRYLRGQR